MTTAATAAETGTNTSTTTANVILMKRSALVFAVMDFASETLDRTFESIIFSGGIR